MGENENVERVLLGKLAGGDVAGAKALLSEDVELRMEGSKTGPSYRIERAMAFTVRDGNVARARHCYDSNAAVKAYEGRGSTAMDGGTDR